MEISVDSSAILWLTCKCHTHTYQIRLQSRELDDSSLSELGKILSDVVILGLDSAISWINPGTLLGFRFDDDSSEGMAASASDDAGAKLQTARPLWDRETQSDSACGTAASPQTPD